MSENEAKIDKLRKDNENWREKLQELQMHNNQNKEENKVDSSGKPQMAPELSELDKAIQVAAKKCEKTEEINKKVQLTQD